MKVMQKRIKINETVNGSNLGTLIKWNWTMKIFFRGERILFWN